MGRGKTRRILVADDDVDTVESFALLLRSLGHTVELATSSAAALELARRSRPELVFLDIGMPGMDGWEVARVLRGEAGPDGVRIIAVTGRGEQEDFSRSRKAGFDAHVVKPMDFDLVKSILAQLD
jgi:CheY-like chemotaxis protein